MDVFDTPLIAGFRRRFREKGLDAAVSSAEMKRAPKRHIVTPYANMVRSREQIDGTFPPR